MLKEEFTCIHCGNQFVNEVAYGVMGIALCSDCYEQYLKIRFEDLLNAYDGESAPDEIVEYLIRESESDCQCAGIMGISNDEFRISRGVLEYETFDLAVLLLETVRDGRYVLTDSCVVNVNTEEQEMSHERSHACCN